MAVLAAPVLATAPDRPYALGHTIEVMEPPGAALTAGPVISSHAFFDDESTPALPTYGQLFPRNEESIASTAVPVNTDPPVVTGSVMLGSMLTCDPGEWTNADSFAYVWLKSVDGISGWQDQGLRGQTYTPQGTDGGRFICCDVLGLNESGQSVAVRSAVVGPVAYPSARYWSINCIEEPTISQWAIAELEMRSAPGGTNLAPAATKIFSRNDFNNINDAFDGNQATVFIPGNWTVGYNHIGCDFGTPVAIKEYTVKGKLTSPQYNARHWQFRYSNDNITWTTVDTQASLVWVAAEVKTFSLA